MPVVNRQPLIDHLPQHARDQSRLRPLQLGLAHLPLGLDRIGSDVRRGVRCLLAVRNEVLVMDP
jgi:hypothetical protein